jgi:hypothetical protein
MSETPGLVIGPEVPIGLTNRTVTAQNILPDTPVPEVGFAHVESGFTLEEFAAQQPKIHQGSDEFPDVHVEGGLSGNYHSARTDATRSTDP